MAILLLTNGCLPRSPSAAAPNVSQPLVLPEPALFSIEPQKLGTVGRRYRPSNRLRGLDEDSDEVYTYVLESSDRDFYGYS